MFFGESKRQGYLLVGEVVEGTGAEDEVGSKSEVDWSILVDSTSVLIEVGGMDVTVGSTVTLRQVRFELRPTTLGPVLS